MSPSKDDPPSNSSAPKATMKGFSFSAKPSSKAGAKPSLKPASSLGKRPRSTFASHHSDSGSEDERPAKHEAVTVFGAEGAIRETQERTKPEGPLVIPMLGNRDWRGEARARIGGRGGGKNPLPAEVQAARRAAVEGSNGARREGVDVVNSTDGEMQWGLSVRTKEDTMVVESESTKAEDEESHTNGGEKQVEERKTPPPKTADEEALDALLGNRKERKGPDLIIPAASAPQDTSSVSETDAYRRAIASAPDVSTLEDYERVPVEEFGAALLRGMGWKGPSADGKTGVREVKRRQNLLGLGAKELKDAEELGAWVQKSDVKRLNGGGGRGERRPKASEYRREKERRNERREERGGSYRREREKDRDGGREYRDRDRRR